MKLVIDIDEETYKKYKMFDGFMSHSEQLIKNGTPLEEVLEEIKAEIEKLKCTTVTGDLWYRGVNDCLEIIDNHISGKE